MSKLPKYERLDKFGSAPIRIVDETLNEEWDNLSPGTKKLVNSQLASFAEKMTHDSSILMLCGVINDLSKRVDELEAKCTN